ncbi:MAG: cation transporter, partial [Psychroserpens sp.]|nr:cation transporter [Psychroserpens sp.]
DGVCLMCKERIEKAAIRTKGVKSAIWNVDTHELKLIYDARKTNLDAITQSIVAVGHDTKEVKATEEAYNSVHPCCKYRDEDVQNDHKN